MILGTKARYAVMAMVDLASRGEGGPVALAELAQTQDIPLPYLEQIFTKLRKKELVKSVRGPGGGYVLARAAASIPIVEIVVAVDESIKMTRCSDHKEEGGCLASRARCKTHHLWEGLGNQIYHYLQGISLQQVSQRQIPVFGINAMDGALPLQQQGTH